MRVEILSNNTCTIELKSGKYLQSYKSIVACIPSDYSYEAIVYPKWDYSRTTAKHVGIFLGSNSKEIREKIKRGIIKEELEEPSL